MPDIPIPYYQTYLNALGRDPVYASGPTDQTKQASAGSDSPTLGNTAPQEPSPQQHEQARRDEKRAEAPPKAPEDRYTAPPLRLGERAFLAQGGMLGKEGREALGGAPPSSSSAPSAQQIPNFSRKLPAQPKPPTR